MIELLLAAIFVCAILYARRYRALRAPALVDPARVSRHGRTVGVVARRTTRGLGPLAAFFLAFGFLAPQTGFRSAGIPVGIDVCVVSQTTGAGTVASLVDSAGLAGGGASFYKDLCVLILSGPDAGKTAVVTASAAGSVSLAPALPSAPGAGNQYVLFSDPTGSVFNAVQQLLGEAGLLFGQSHGPTVVDASSDAVHYFAQYYFDRTSGAIASANIDLTTTPASVRLAKSHAGGAFSTAGVTQPTLAKANGVASSTVTFKAAEWAIGDDWQLLTNGVLVTDSQGNVEKAIQAGWVGKIDVDTTTSGNVTTIKNNIGTNADAAGTGTLFAWFAKLFLDIKYLFTTAVAAPTADSISDQMYVGAGTPLRTFIAKGTGKPIAANKSLADAIGHDGTTDNLTGVSGKLGTPANATIAADIAEVEGETDTIISTLGTPAGPTVSADIAAIRAEQDADEAAILGRLGNPVGASLAADIAEIEGETDSILSTLGTPAAASVSADIAEVAADTDAIYARQGAPAGASMSADTAAVRADTAAVKLKTDLIPAAGPPDAAHYTNARGDKLDDLDATVSSRAPSATAVSNADYTATRAGYLDNHWRVSPSPVTAVADAAVGSGSEDNLLDVGTDAGTIARRLDGALCNVASMGANTQIKFRLKAEINGTLTQIGNDVVRTGTGAFDLLSLLGVTPTAARHVRVTVTGDNAANNGSVAATFVTSIAGV